MLNLLDFFGKPPMPHLKASHLYIGFGERILFLVFYSPISISSFINIIFFLKKRGGWRGFESNINNISKISAHCQGWLWGARWGAV